MPLKPIPIDLASGFPAPALNPIIQLNHATNTVFSTPEIWHDGMIYGAEAGYDPLRRNLARWLAHFYTSNESEPLIDPDRICVTGGASQNLACLLQVFTDPVFTKNIYIVEPGYFLSFCVFEDAGFHGRLRGVPEDEEGIDLDFLEDMLKRDEETSALNDQRPCKPVRSYRKLYRHVIYCVPTFSNPSGKIMSLSRRKELVRLARKYDALIIADDVYDLVHWRTDSLQSPPLTPGGQSESWSCGSRPASPTSNSSCSPEPARFKCIVPRLVDIDRTLDGGPSGNFGNCVSNGSFSKIVGPGCRVGWAEGTPAFAYGLSQAGSSRSGGAPSHLMSTFINEMLGEDSLMTNHILHTLIPAYSRRHATLTCAVEQYICPLGVTMVSNKYNVGGGFFLWLKLPSPLNGREFVVAAREDGVIVSDGTLSSLPDDNRSVQSYENMIRLCFAWADEDRLAEGIMRFAQTLKRLLAGQSERLMYSRM